MKFHQMLKRFFSFQYNRLFFFKVVCLFFYFLLKRAHFDDSQMNSVKDSPEAHAKEIPVSINDTHKNKQEFSSLDSVCNLYMQNINQVL